MIVFLIGCGNPIKEDMTNYANELNKIAKSLELMNGKMGQIGDNKEAYLKTIRESVIPFFNDTIEKLDNMTLKTKEVSEINIIFKNSIELYSEAFDQLVDAAQYMDEDQMKKAEQTEKEAENKLDEASDKWDMLAKKYDVENLLKKFMNGIVKQEIN